MKNKDGKFLYAELADRIQDQVEKGAFSISEKLPSLRTLCQETGYSMTTVFQAYLELEKRGIVESRQRSGYYLRARLQRLQRTPEIKYHPLAPKKNQPGRSDPPVDRRHGQPGYYSVWRLGGDA